MESTNGVATLLAEEKILHFCKKHQLLNKGSRILVAVSGGPDSMALLHFLVKMREKFNLKLVALSVDHQLRKEESQKDVEYVRQICEKWKVRFIDTSLNVPLYKERTKKSTELAARELRYAFFAEQMDQFDNPYLAMGHHGDDQVETMLMQLMRGTKPKGMPIKRRFANGLIIRPFLCLSKQEINEYCMLHQINPRIDATNNELVYTRNALRHQVLPLLKKHNPSIHESAQMYNEVIQEEERFLIGEAEKVVKEAVKFNENQRTAVADIGKISLYAQTLQRRAFHLILNYLYNNVETEIQSIHLENLLQLTHSNKPNAVIHLPNNLTASKAYKRLTFTFMKKQVASYEFKLNPGEQMVLPNGATLMVELLHQSEKPMEKGTHIFVCDGTHIKLPLLVRSRYNGDKIKVKGLGGSKKLKDVFIDQKIPAQLRDSWPVVTDNKGEIIWLPGLKKGEVSESPLAEKWLRLIYEQNEYI